jgi:hypothetical protein
VSRRYAVSEYRVTAVRTPDWDDPEVRRRIGRVYALIFQLAAKARAEGTADRGEFGDLTRPAADGAPAVKPEEPDAV